MNRSANGWPVLQYGSSLLHRWVIPTNGGDVEITLRQGSVGFLICLFIAWWADKIEPVAGRIMDDWGHAIRTIRGQTTGYSNHAMGGAADINAVQHPLGTRTLSVRKKSLIWAYLKTFRGVLRSGAFYNGRVDEMHVEINVPTMGAVEACARRKMNGKRGRRILDANPSQRRVIMS